eukprot:TRINITY_DN9435_c0_g1_i1.p1 TRINITY_DN9435_c0_g1~~TRINITY_DN9435_c0_g1_i1.p1  ORF type:complete len:328 (+),score=70.65 TRINITY_DN9435_c0_g1_i1:170-1153(+)
MALEVVDLTSTKYAELPTRESMERPCLSPADKNRYRTVLAVPEETRVRLRTDHCGDGGDYINANFINGEIEGSNRDYIACQAPLQNTIQDFWRMIWEQNCGIVVMLTPLVEFFGANQDEEYVRLPMSRVQADRYWPEEGQIARYGNILVGLNRTFLLGEITIRSLLIRKVNSDENSDLPAPPTREIIQLHFEGWPDDSVPLASQSICDILFLMNKLKKRAATQHNLSGPVVVHCSAGLGRTGAFIASAIALEMIVHNQPVVVKRIVDNIRKQRVGLVRTTEQYQMIFEVIKQASETPGYLWGFSNLATFTTEISSPTPSTTSSPQRD